MERKHYYAQPKIVDRIVELQKSHSLPINIFVGECVSGLTEITFEYELIDYHLVAWLVNKGTEYYTCLPPEEIMDDDD
ncbi:MAG: hypothetical protein K6G92_06765 [Bacteroidaceae bacterium]|nr:hypothetical protein [Bacteroidaceae bacterium]